MNEILPVFRPGERFATMAENGEVRVFEVRIDGIIVSVYEDETPATREMDPMWGRDS